MATLTLSQIKTLVRQRADIENSQFIQDTELTAYINASIAELYDLLISKYEDYFISDPVAIALVDGTDSYSLPADFYKLVGVDFKLNTSDQWITLKPFMFNERNRFRGPLYPVTNGGPIYRYRLRADKITFSPIPSGSQSVQVWYIPLVTYLALDADLFKAYMGYEEYVILDAAIKCLNKEESDASDLLAQKVLIKDRIESTAANRDAGFSQKISDTTSNRFDSDQDDGLFW